MGFPKYPELPLELRLQVIEHAIETYSGETPKRHGLPENLAQFASIHSDWNKIIERILFESIDINNQDLDQFANICGKRQGLLRRIRLQIHPGSLSIEDDFLDCLSQLFHAMKGWSGTDRRPHDLIRLTISIYHLREDDPMARGPVESSLYTFSCDLKNLPVVSVIGEIRVNQEWYDDTALHHSALNSLREKLPNLFSAYLDFPFPGHPQGMIDDASSKFNRQLQYMHIGNMSITFSKTGSLHCTPQSQA